MKKFYTYLTMALVAVTVCVGFTSCDDDDDEHIAYNLSGEWQGRLGVDYYSRWGWEGGNDYYTVIRFYRRGGSYTYGATSGYGEEVDYLDGRRFYGYYREFRWYVDFREITLTYDDGEVARIYIDRMTNTHFLGTIEYNSNKTARFDLTKTYDFNWDRFDDYGFYGYYSGDYYYGPQKPEVVTEELPADSTKN